ncbi:hypothetical protein [Treponema pedis]|uniref:Uncharacterized protein n=1 Tax=Treponema pedis TaxID=409322 RepID=A0A7S7AVY1_9SPIR|nr:hypothetical protein [Treponema pedis]QOW60051.1 hypothetical protein IFE08_09360 [Treponema pedis]
MIFLSNFIQKIIDFFLSLFSSNTEDYKTQKALRALASELKKAKYPVFRPETTILAGFPIIIYELYRTVLPIYSILKASIASSDIRISGLFLDKIVESGFSKEQQELKASLTLEKRCEKFENFLDENFDSKVKEQNKAFNDLLFNLTEPKFNRFDSIVNKLYAFFDLCEFKFNSFFAHFDSGFEPFIGTNSIRDQYNFQNIEGQEVLQEILDLDYLIRRIIIDEDFISGLYFLNSKLPEDLKREESFIQRALQNFSYIIENNLGIHSLRNLAKLIKKDPLFEDSIKPKIAFSAIEEYKQRVTAIFNADSKKILKMQQEAQMANLIDNLFHNTEMLTVAIYNEELNKRIQAVTNLSLDWIKPLEIIKTYTKMFFEPKIEPFLRELIVEGFFEDKNFQKDLSADYYFCSSILDKLNEFEKFMSGRNENSIDLIKGYLTRLETGGDFEKNLSKIIDAVNLKALSIVREAGKHYFDLFKAAGIIEKDAHKAIPDYVNNLKAMIISTKNKERFSAFEESMTSFENFIEILKHYVILDIPGLV